MNRDELRVVQAAITYRNYRNSINAGIAGDLSQLGKLLDAVDALIFGCPECNQGGHVCPGDGKSIPHGNTDCGGHDWPCVDCIQGDEDPAPWCDCRRDEESCCPPRRPCRKRAHDMSKCLNAPRCDSPSPEGDRCRFIDGHQGPHQWDQWEAWVPATWGDVRNSDRVRLGTAEANVRTVNWHVDPRSNEYRPHGIGSDSVGIQLEGRDVMVFPKSGPVEIFMDEARRAEHVINQRFKGTERVISE